MRSRLGWKVHLSLAGGIVASRHISTTSHLIFRDYLFTIPGKERSFAIFLSCNCLCEPAMETTIGAAKTLVMDFIFQSDLI
ncbi:unnamed protein product [Porites lobata]|uniref:Uncharacterized protein n=1 Tax=Porites lobata TaxID=104759 RepID=A0ABN8RA16_9CNID|nr:unnamed protein product [Porites lobata]